MHTHSKISKLLWFLVVVIIGVFAFWLYKPQVVSSPENSIDENLNDKVSVAAYENYLHNFRFEYPSNLYMKESEKGTPQKPQLSIVLVDGIKENIDLIEGIYTGVPREGPTMITIDVYTNDKKLTPAQWAEQDVNWNIGTKEIYPVVVSGKQGVYYTWSGLYEGETVIVTKDTSAYVFSVTHLTLEDQISKDFDMILNSFSFSQ